MHFLWNFFLDKGTHTRHLSSHKEKTFKCKDCDSSFLEKKSLVKHEFIHQEDRADRPFKCSTCDTKFKTLTILERHSTLHHDMTKSFECDICKYRYSTEQKVKIHKQQYHLKVRIEQEWPECKTILKDRGALISHMKRNGHQQPYGCKECLARFVDISTL